MVVRMRYQAARIRDRRPHIDKARYSEFDDLRQRLVASFPHAKSALPALPPKSVFCMFVELVLGACTDVNRQIPTEFPRASTSRPGILP